MQAMIQQMASQLSHAQSGPNSIDGWLTITLILCLYVQAVIDFKILSLSFSGLPRRKINNTLTSLYNSIFINTH